MEKEDIMLPPWKKYPKLKRGSIGWRMGYGEEYLIKWHNWFEKLSSEERNAYKEKYKRPFIWLGFYKNH